MKIAGFISFLMISLVGLCQQAVDSSSKSPWKFYVYADVYLGVNSLNNTDTLPYFVSHNQSRGKLNLLFVGLGYTGKKFRFKVLPGTGSFVQSNYAAEPHYLRWPIEANFGFCLSEKRGIWMDAGVLGSPYTNETPLSKDHISYTRSLAAEYVPYYLSGIKLSLPFTKKITFYPYLVNGWQQIKDINPSLSFGSQLEIKPNACHAFYWDTYVGSEYSKANEGQRLRIFTDFWWQWNSDKRWRASASSYLGFQEYSSSPTALWAQANIQAGYKLWKSVEMAARAEVFSDADQAMIQLLDQNIQHSGIYGGSLGLNVLTDEQFYLRMEVRYLQSDAAIFKMKLNEFSDRLIWFNLSLTVFN